MNVGGGEAADQLVRMILSGYDVTLRLGASTIKNVLALSMALAKDHRKLCGKVNMSRMLRETRDLRTFPMSEEQYEQFRNLSKKHGILYSAIRNKDDPKAPVDVVIPATDVERANLVFSEMAALKQPNQSRQSTGPQQINPTVEEPAPGPLNPVRESAAPTEEQVQNPVCETPGVQVTNPAQETSVPPQNPSGTRDAEQRKKGSPLPRDSPGTRSNSSIPEISGKTNERLSVEVRLQNFRKQIHQKKAPGRQKVKARTRKKSR